MELKEKKGALLISLIVLLVVFVALIAIGNVIVIGDKISNISPFLSFVFYAIVVILIVWAIVLPCIRVVMASPLGGFNTEDLKSLSPIEMTKFIRDLRKRIHLSHEEERELRLGKDRKQTVVKILNRRHEEMERVVKDSAVTNFTITAISQNGTFDFISSMAINLRMISHIVRKLGVRPSYSQLFQLYASVLSASLVITTLDDIFDDIDYGEILGSLGVVGGQVVKIAVPSLTNGLMNALLTLRVGYTTIKYLEVGKRSFDKSEARKWAIKSARKQLLTVGKEGMGQIAGKIKQGVSEL